MEPFGGSPAITGLPPRTSVLLLGGIGAGGSLRPLARSALGMAGTGRRVLLVTGRIFRRAGRGRRLVGVLHLLTRGVFLCAGAAGLRERGRSDQQGRRDDECLVHEWTSFGWFDDNMAA